MMAARSVKEPPHFVLSIEALARLYKLGNQVLNAAAVVLDGHIEAHLLHTEIGALPLCQNLRLPNVRLVPETILPRTNTAL